MLIEMPALHVSQSGEDQETKAELASIKDGLTRLTLERTENGTVKWSVSFDKNIDNS